ncbi:hypothetical protein A3218_02650 [Pseudomonas chlororaphis]|nr:hypothetical protein A3218_02650 [Pseudomonas chlororaphis]
MGLAVGGNFVTEKDIKQEHIDLFFKDDQTKIKFMLTDWEAFFNKHAPNRASESKIEFLNRIEFVKQQINNN